MPQTRREFIKTAATGSVTASLVAGGAISLLSSPALAQTVDVAELMKPGPLGEMALGDESAAVTVIEYASMTCGHCARFHAATYHPFKEQYVDTGKVRFVFREFPLDNLALGVFMLARCAPENTYFDVVDLFFKTQGDWAVAGQNPLPPLFAVAKQVGFTKETFETCLKNQDLVDGINEVKNAGRDQFEVNSTPTFFINGKKVSGALTLDQLGEEIDPLL